MFLDRHDEREVLDQVVSAVRSGTGRALVVRGEPGVGKTALLDYLVERAPGCRVARASGVQSEMELDFAGLHQLCGPILDRLERLPHPQRDALCTAFGISAGEPPDRFLVGLAVLGLLAEVAQERPLICVVDDAQWLDRASVQALAFAARRLVAEAVALVFAAREADEVPELAGLPELTVVGLPDDEARELLGGALGAQLDDQVRDRIIAESRGNPLALLELPKGLTAAELAGGFARPSAPGLPRQLEQCYQRRFEALPAETQRLLQVAAAEPLGDPVLVWRAAEQLGISVEAVTPAAGLLEIGAKVRFRHPLVRSAIYQAASPEERHHMHHALARATDPETDPDRRAWHQAQAARGPDEDTAADLQRSAGRAQSRGGLAAAAAFQQRAAELTLDPARRAERALAAAQTTHQAGAPDAALRLLSLAEAGPLDKLQQAQADLLRAQIAFAVNRGSDAPPLLLKAAAQLEPLHPKLARETYLDALSAAQFAGRLASNGCVFKAARKVRHAPPPAWPARPSDLLLDGLATRFTEGYAAATPVLRRALSAFRDQDISAEDGLRWLWLAGTTAADLWDHESWDLLATRHVALARDAGALTTLPLALTSRIVVHTFAGELTEAASLVEEVTTVTEAIGIHLAPYGALLLAAWQGRAAEATALIESTATEVARRGEGIGLTVASYAAAVLYNSLCRHSDALAEATHSIDNPAELGASTWALAELIEAAARSGTTGAAPDALDRLSAATRASGTDWALGVAARSRALLSDGQAAERAYQEAIDRLGRTRILGELARAHLLYGEWLSREKRHLEARKQLRTAHEMFTRMGMAAFAERAAGELQTIGESTPKRTVENGSELTAQEAHIVRLVREGLSNPEIGARLFISHRTVEWHLRKIFSKLNITSRRQLQS